MVGSSSTSAMRRAIGRDYPFFCHIPSPPRPLPAPARAPRARVMTLPTHPTGRQGDERMQGTAARQQPRIQDAIGDFARLVAKAFLGGIGVAIAMSLAILALSANVQAATINEAKAGTLL